MHSFSYHSSARFTHNITINFEMIIIYNDNKILMSIALKSIYHYIIYQTVFYNKTIYIIHLNSNRSRTNEENRNVHLMHKCLDINLHLLEEKSRKKKSSSR